MKSIRLLKLLGLKTSTVCPASRAGSFDSSFRRKLQNPSSFLRSYVKIGMKTLDLGCGNGFCTFDMAAMVGQNGLVVAADLQQEMLDMLAVKIGATDFKNIKLHKCNETSINLAEEQFDFINVFYMFHEMSDHAAALRQLKLLLKPNGKILIAEPKFHVRKAFFKTETDEMLAAGFKILERPKIFFSRSVVIACQ